MPDFVILLTVNGGEVPSVYIMFLSKYFFYVWDHVKVTLFFLQHNKAHFSGSIVSTLANFKNTTFENEYIFH